MTMLCGLRLGLAAFAATLAAPCAAEPSAEARTYLETALGLLQQGHINSAKADWPALTATARNLADNAQTPADTYPAIRAVIAALGERHTFLREARPASVPGATAASTSPRAEQSLPEGRLVDGRFGLIALPMLDTVGADRSVESRYTDALIGKAQELDRGDLCGWIVDLRMNHGGNMWPMLAGLDPLLGSGPFGFFVAPAAITPWQRTAQGIFPVDAPPTTRPRYTLQHQSAPVAVLLGPRTASSGEMVAIALVGRDGVRTFGQASAGLTTGNQVKPLTDGAYLVLTTVTVRDRTGRDYEGPLQPDVPTGTADPLDAAKTWLAEHCPAG